MPDPHWLRQMRAAGQVLTETAVNPATLAPGIPYTPPGAAEVEFQRQVIDFARGYGWKVAHFRAVQVLKANGETFWQTPVDADGKGFLDLELVRERLVKAELKVGRNPMTPEQRDWSERYERAAVEWYVWYPTDWETIARVLQPRSSSSSDRAGTKSKPRRS